MACRWRSPLWLAVVQTDDPKPTRRLFEVLQSQDHPLNQPLTLLSAGGDTVRALQRYLNPQAAHLLDWFPVTMRLTVLQQTAKGLPATPQAEEGTSAVRAPEIRSLARRHGLLGHGHGYQAVPVIESVEGDLEVAVATSRERTARQLLNTVEEFPTSIQNKAGFLPNDGARYRHDARIRTGLVASTVHQGVSKRRGKTPQRQWSKRGAQLLLQMRTRVLNGAWEDTFRTWDPGFRAHAMRTAASPVPPCRPTLEAHVPDRTRGHRRPVCGGSPGVVPADNGSSPRSPGSCPTQGTLPEHHRPACPPLPHRGADGRLCGRIPATQPHIRAHGYPSGPDGPAVCPSARGWRPRL